MTGHRRTKNRRRSRKCGKGGSAAPPRLRAPSPACVSHDAHGGRGGWVYCRWFWTLRPLSFLVMLLFSNRKKHFYFHLNIYLSEIMQMMQCMQSPKNSMRERALLCKSEGACAEVPRHAMQYNKIRSNFSTRWHCQQLVARMTRLHDEQLVC